MKALHLRELLPNDGSIGISGGVLEEQLIKAIGYKNAEGASLSLVPTTPRQARLAQSLDIPVEHGYPEYFILQCEGEGPHYFLESTTDSVFADRMLALLSEHLWVLVTKNEDTFLIETVQLYSSKIRESLQVYGEILKEAHNSIGHRLFLFKPFVKDYVELASALREIPGVIDVGVYREVPEKIIRVTSP